MLNGATAAVLLNADGEPEIFQFTTVSLGADGVYTLTGLLRGRRGTEGFVGSHAKGDFFILLRDGESAVTGVDATLQSLSERNISRYWRALGRGQTLEDVEPQSFTNSARCLMPFSVVHIAAVPSGGNTNVTWVRRTRLDGSLMDGSGTVPLGETSEEYEVDVRAVGSGTVTRMVTGLTSPAWTYLAADKTTDWGTPPAQVEIDIYQISSLVGRGFKATATIGI
jgi:hypothetical protein